MVSIFDNIIIIYVYLSVGRLCGCYILKMTNKFCSDPRSQDIIFCEADPYVQLLLIFHCTCHAEVCCFTTDSWLYCNCKHNYFLYFIYFP